MAKGTKSKYAKVSGARPSLGGNYLRAGHVIVRTDAVREGESSNKKGDFIAHEMTVVKVLGGPAGYDYNRKVDLPLHSVGETPADIMMLSNVAFEGRIKALAMVGGELTEEDFNDEAYEGELIDELVGETQPLAGVALEVRSTTVIKQNAKSKTEDQLDNGDVYTRHDYVRKVPFSELPELLGEDVAAKFFPDLEAQIAAENE